MQKLALCLDSHCQGGHPVRSPVSARSMLEIMNPGGWLYDTASFPGGEIGVVHAPAAQTTGNRAEPLARTGTGPGLMRLDNGDIIAWSGLPLAEGKRVNLSAASDLPALAPTLDGIFAAIGWSAAEQKLYVVNDFLGLQPLYVGDDGAGGWIAATETKAFPYTPDPAGWGAFIILGYPIGRASVTRHAERLRPATVLTVAAGGQGARLANRQIETSRYWQMPEEGPEPAPEAAAEALTANTAAYQALTDANVCLLSGGFDSRIILAALHKLDVEGRRALILDHSNLDGDLDGKLARQVARRTRTAIHYQRPDAAFFSSRDYLEYVRAIDGSTPNLYLFISQLASTLRGSGAVWEGLIPALALSTLQQVGDGSFDAFAKQKFNTGTPVVQMFRPAAWRSFVDAFHAEFERTRALYPDTAHGMWQWIVENRMRNRAGVNPTKVYANHATPLMVGASRRLWETAAPVPFRRRQDHGFYLDVFRALSPELTRVPFYSGGTMHRGDAPWLAYTACQLTQKGWRAIAGRPRLSRLVRVGEKFGFAPSRFVRHPALYEEEDDTLDMDVVRRAKDDIGLRKVIGKQLFHWRAARWIHEDRLFSTLQET